MDTITRYQRQRERERRAFTISTLLGMLLVALAIVFWFVGPAKAGESTEIYSKKLEQGWTISCFHVDDNPRAFSHCALYTTYYASKAAQKRVLRADEMSFFLTLHSGAKSMTISMVSNGWRVTAGKKHEVKFDFPNKNNYTAVGIEQVFPDGAGAIMVPSKTNGNIIDDLSSQSGFKVAIGGKDLGAFTLSGSAVAIKHLIAATMALSQANTGDTFGSSSLEDTF